MKGNDIKVSVYCLAYNHEKYIRDALEGFVRQKTNFKYEVIVHDDASTDNTADIIREYAEKYPDIIKPIYQMENQHSKRVNIVREFIISKVHGEYVAVCEGDDYWTDENKLQLQYEVMRQHPECSMCAHYVKVENMSENNRVGYSSEVPSRNRKLKEGVISSGEWIRITVEDLIHLSSTFMRADYFIEYRSQVFEYAVTIPVGDIAMCLYMATKGSLYFMDRTMSTYRKGVEGSWTVRIQNDPERHRRHRQRYIKGLELYKEFLNGRYEKDIDHAILHYKFADARADGDYRRAVGKEFKELIKERSWKFRLKLYLNALNPRIINSFKKIKNCKS